jgi:hypothetical protein
MGLLARMLVVTALICLEIVEIMLRLLLPSTTIALMRGGHYVWYAGYRTYVPLAHWPGGNEAGEQFEVSFDEMGLRNPTQSLARADVMVLGDSFIAADNTPIEHTLVGELRAAGVASYNAGVDGAGTFNEVHLLRDHLRGWHGRVVVVAFLSRERFPRQLWRLTCPRTVQRSRHAPHARPNGRGLAHDMQSSFHL